VATFKDLVPPERNADEEAAWVARGKARIGETVEEAVARGVKIHVAPPDWRSGEKIGGQWTSKYFKVVPPGATPKPVRPPSPKRLARSTAGRIE